MVDPHNSDPAPAQGTTPRESSVESFTGAELPYRNLYLVGILLAVVSVGMALAIFPLNDLLVRMADKQWEGDIVPDQGRSAGARLQQKPESDWQVFELLMSDRLQSYGWQDQANGIARIPVRRAMELALSEQLIASTDDAMPAVLRGVAPSHEASGEQPGHAGSEQQDHGEASR